MVEKAAIDKKVEERYKQAKDLPLADIKIILLGDSAVGKSKYASFCFTHLFRLVERFLLND